MIWLSFKSDSGGGVWGAKPPGKARGFGGPQAPHWGKSYKSLGTGSNPVKSEIILLARKPTGCLILCLSTSMYSSNRIPCPRVAMVYCPCSAHDLGRDIMASLFVLSVPHLAGKECWRSSSAAHGRHRHGRLYQESEPTLQRCLAFCCDKVTFLLGQGSASRQRYMLCEHVFAFFSVWDDLPRRVDGLLPLSFFL